MTKLFLLVVASLCVATGASGDPWDHIGPSNLFNDKDMKGEAGTVASAAASGAQPNIIYAGGSNNGVSTGIIKSIDGGLHWTRNSNGIWNTQIFGTWIHPDDPSSDHVFAGTGSGIYESTDGAASWKLREETKNWGYIMSFREGVINGEKYIFANSGGAILTMPYEGGAWNRIPVPDGEYLATNAELSVVTHDGISEAVMCFGGFKSGGRLYYFDFTSPTNGTWTKTSINGCVNVAVDPNDRNHFLYTNATYKRSYESKDAGKTYTKLLTPSPTFFVMIQKNNFYYSGNSGSYVSYNEGKNWSRYQAVFHPRSGGTTTRGAHDFQRIIPYFQGDGIAFTSDQGLHIVNGTEQNLTSAIGDMSNCDVLGLSVSPGDQDGPRKLVATMWDWSAAASWDDGATWAAWDLPTEKDIQKPGIGEGGGTMNLGMSDHILMWHHSTNWYSNNGGKNLTKSIEPLGGLRHSHDYLRLKGSRTEPSGTVFTLATVYSSDSMDRNDSMDTTEDSEDTTEDSEEDYTSSGTRSTNLLVSEDFGVTWTSKTLPDFLQNVEQVVVNPDADDLFAVTSNCLAKSTDKGSTWGACSYTPAQGSPDFTALTVISSSVMFLSRGGSLPLRTTDGGHTWTELASAAPLFKTGASYEVTPSGSGETLVFHGSDRRAISNNAFGTKVWKSTNNGDDWSDETGDIVTITLGHAVWFEKDFYIISGGEGVMVKRNFEA